MGKESHYNSKKDRVFLRATVCAVSIARYDAVRDEIDTFGRERG